MLHIGITGGIGSGKSTVCHLFSLLNIPIYDSDSRAKWLMEHDPEVKKRIRQVFGKKAYTGKGALNRTYLASIVFPNPDKLKELNKIVHPAVFKDTEEWLKSIESPYTIRESALLFESGYDKYVDVSILVFAPKSVRIKRIMDRDGLSKSQIEERMQRQMPESEKQKKADYIVHNDGNNLLIPQILKLHRLFLEMAQAQKADNGS